MNPASAEVGGLLAGIPDSLRIPLLNAYREIVRNFRERRWEPAELNGGKLCEIIYSILRGLVDGAYPDAPAKPQNMVDACRQLEQTDQNKFSRSVRIQIPRMLLALYEIRNNRGVGHTGGDVDPNHMDAAAVLGMSKWLLAELVRIFHSVDTETARATVDALVDRTNPVVWDVAGVKRVLRPDLSFKDKALLLVYSHVEAVAEAELFRWSEHSNAAVFRRDVLTRAHKEKLIEYDRMARRIHLSPLGITYVESLLLRVK
ncbi:MAG: hypothetical protein HZA32_13720 [Opitutae bacterium]|nr:hypothetical protein [Opitutae bacterium]